MKKWMRVAMAMLVLTASVAAAQTAPPAQRLELPSVPSADLADNSVQFVGTATVIIRIGGITILTDPGDKVHLGYGLTATRLTDPAMNLEALAPIDLVILSHFHEDHFDRLVQQKLDRNLPIVNNAASAEHLRKLGFKRATGLATWGRIDIVNGDTTLAATAMPGAMDRWPWLHCCPT